MNQVTQESKDSVMKTMAVIGFIAVIIFGVWLAVQIVQVIPNAFSSLASIADGVYNNRPTPTLMVAASESIVNNQEAFTVSWTDLGVAGTYAFTYSCEDGVAIDAKTSNNQVVSVTCDTPLNLSEEVTSIELTAESEKRRFTDINYTVAFTAENPAEEVQERSAQFTIVNPSIPQSVAVSETDTTDESETTGSVAGENTTDTTATPAPAPRPTVTETPILAIPTSDPNGFVDLEVQFLGVGTMNNSNQFTRTASIDNDTRGSFQFAVRNVGTKTSADWDFTATLTSGTEYESRDQEPLKPNERSIITLGFDAVGETGIQFFGAEANTSGDINQENDSFTWAVEVTS